MREKIKILIVEDEYLIARETGSFFQMMDFEVCELAASGEEAIRIAKREKPDIALMDIRLSGQLDGIETAREIREFADIPIIFMSGYQGDEHKKGYAELEPIAYFEKPISARKIGEKIREVFTPS